MRSAIDEHLVGAATEFTINQRAVYQCERAIISRFDMRVITRSPRVVQNDAVVRGAADGARDLREENVFPLAAAGVSDFQECHDKRIGLKSAGGCPREINTQG